MWLKGKSSPTDLNIQHFLNDFSFMLVVCLPPTCLHPLPPSTLSASSSFSVSAVRHREFLSEAPLWLLALTLLPESCEAESITSIRPDLFQPSWNLHTNESCSVLWQSPVFHVLLFLTITDDSNVTDLNTLFYRFGKLWLSSVIRPPMRERFDSTNIQSQVQESLGKILIGHSDVCLTKSLMCS